VVEVTPGLEYTVMTAVALRLFAGILLLFAYTVKSPPTLSVGVKVMLAGVMEIAEIEMYAVALAVEVTL
jgi:hypothetical protein